MSTNQIETPALAAPITKSTLVPLGAVMGAVFLTVGAMNYLGSDRGRIDVLETRSAQISNDVKETHTKLDAQAEAIAHLTAQVAVLNSKLDKAP